MKDKLRITFNNLTLELQEDNLEKGYQKIKKGIEKGKKAIEITNSNQIYIIGLKHIQCVEYLKGQNNG